MGILPVFPMRHKWRGHQGGAQVLKMLHIGLALMGAGSLRWCGIQYLSVGDRYVCPGVLRGDRRK